MRIDAPTNATLTRVSPFLLFLPIVSAGTARPPRLLRRPGDDDAAAGYFVSTAVPRLRIIDY